MASVAPRMAAVGRSLAICSCEVANPSAAWRTAQSVAALMPAGNGDGDGPGEGLGDGDGQGVGGMGGVGGVGGVGAGPLAYASQSWLASAKPLASRYICHFVVFGANEVSHAGPDARKVKEAHPGVATHLEWTMSKQVASVPLHLPLSI